MASSALTNGRSISSRKLDSFYIVFIFISVLLATFLDFVPLWPFPLPNWYTAPREAYIRDYNDPLYALDPPFFQLFMWIELFALVPGGLIVAWALIKGSSVSTTALMMHTWANHCPDHKLAPLYLLVWATYYVTSTAVCFVEMIYAKDWPVEDIARNRPGYIVFGLVGTGMLLDAFSRIKAVLLGKQKSA